MRLRLAVAALCAAILSFGVAEAKPAVPPGSYLKTCEKASVSKDGTLSARCRDKNGKAKAVKLTRVADCLGDIRNENGKLVCVRRSALPAGLWTSACRAFVFDGRVLGAECRRTDGRFRKTRVNVAECPTALLNKDGRLVCDLPGERPMGSWARSCRLFGIAGGNFQAECLDSRGRWIASSLRDNACRTGYGVAADGRLACERKRFVPRGSWAATCDSFDVAGDLLAARCADWRPRWQRSTGTSTRPSGPTRSTVSSTRCNG